MDMTQVMRSDPEFPLQVVPGTRALVRMAEHGWLVRLIGRTEGGMPLYDVAGYDAPTEIYIPVEDADRLEVGERRHDLMTELAEALAPDTQCVIHEVSYTGLRCVASWSYVMRNGKVSYVDHHQAVRDSMRTAEEDVAHEAGDTDDHDSG